MRRNKIKELADKILEFQVVDLSYTLEKNIPVWPSHPQYEHTIVESFDKKGDSYHCKITIGEHCGTHIDAPSHFYKNGKNIDELEISQIMGACVNIPAMNTEKLYSIESLKEFERNNFEIQERDIVMFRFGWDEKYDLYPNSSEFLKNWPGLSKEVSEYLVSKKVSAVGCDTLSIDAFSSDFVAHNAFLRNGIPIIENVKNLDKIPAYSYVIGFPLKIKDGSGSTMRLVALVEK